MLIIVIENPIQFTIVSAVPFDSATVFCAIRVENKGESAITTIPQNIREKIKNQMESMKKSKGEKRQHVPDRSNA
jgi:hypothetical protein